MNYENTAEHAQAVLFFRASALPAGARTVRMWRTASTTFPVPAYARGTRIHRRQEQRVLQDCAKSIQSMLAHTLLLRSRAFKALLPPSIAASFGAGPASPFVRIIAAPSAMRRSASPRSRHPHTYKQRELGTAQILWPGTRLTAVFHGIRRSFEGS